VAAAELQQAHRLQALRAVLHEKAVGRSFALLRAHGVAPILGKGWAAARLYPDRGLRPYGDVDLYVRAEERDAARTAVASPDADCPIDLHPGFAELDDRTPEQLAERAVHAEADGQPVRLFGPEDHLRLLGLHALRHGLVRPLWLCDVAAAVEGRAPSFDWDRFLHGNPTRTRWVVAAVALAREIVGARLEGLPPAARMDRLPGWMVPAVLSEWGRPRPAQGARRPMAEVIGHRRDLLQALRTRWPNPIEATVGVGGSFGAWPRLPYQLADCARRTVRFVAGITRPSRRL
jgi:hypothetical protein